MKKNLIFCFAALLLAGTFSCQKESLIGDNSPAKQWAAQPKPSVTLTMNNSVIEGDPIVFTVNLSYNGSAVTCGRVSIQKLDTAGNWNNIIDPSTEQPVVINNTSGQVTYTISEATMDDAGTYRASFNKAAGAEVDCGYAAERSGEMTLEVITSCSGLSLTPELVTVNGNNFTVKYTVKACDAYTGLKLQGGLTAGCTNISYTSGGSAKTTNKNTIISWNVGSMSANESKSYYVSFTKSVATSGSTILTGAWSVKGKDAANNDVTVGYNNAITYTPVTE